MLAWLSLSNDTDEWVNVSENVATDVDVKSVSVMEPSSPDQASLMEVPLPGHGPIGRYFRLQMTASVKFASCKHILSCPQYQFVG